MINNILCKIIRISVLSAAFYVPIGTAAPVTQFTFNTTIQEVVTPLAPSPLSIGDSISGDIQFDHANLTPYVSPDPDLSMYAGAGANISGSVQSATASWQQGPFYVLTTALRNDWTVTQGYLDSLPTFANTTNFPDLPSVGDVIDTVDITAYDDPAAGSTHKLFWLEFVFKQSDNVVTGSTLADVDFTKLFSNLIYGRFGTGEYTDVYDKIWTASGPLYQASPVPIPAAVWLFGSGLLGLFGIGRRRAA